MERLFVSSLLCLTLGFLLNPSNLFSQDLKGVQFQYQKVTSQTFEGRLLLYSDPQVIVSRPFVLFNWTALDTLFLINELQLSSELIKREYLGYFTYAGNSSYSLSYYEGYRVGEINNFDNDSQVELIGLTGNLVLDPFLSSNSSPIINNSPLNIINDNGIYTYFPNVWDPDSDSLYFEIVDCIGNGYYIPENLTINHSDGTLRFIPEELGSYSICTKIKQWNSGIYAGDITYDVLFEVDNIMNVPEEVSENRISISPNPVSDILTLNTRDNKVVNYTIYDIAGRQLLNGTFINTQEVDVSAWPSGIYIIRIETESGIYQEKVVKK